MRKRSSITERNYKNEKLEESRRRTFQKSETRHFFSTPSTTKMNELIGFNSHYYQQLS